MHSADTTQEERRRRGLRVSALIFAGTLVLSLLLAGGFVAYVWQARRPVTVGGWSLIGPNCQATVLLSMTVAQNRQFELWAVRGGVAVGRRTLLDAHGPTNHSDAPRCPCPRRRRKATTDLPGAGEARVALGRVYGRGALTRIRLRIIARVTIGFAGGGRGHARPLGG